MHKLVDRELTKFTLCNRLPRIESIRIEKYVVFEHAYAKDIDNTLTKANNYPKFYEYYRTNNGPPEILPVGFILVDVQDISRKYMLSYRHNISLNLNRKKYRSNQ